ncbi:putative antirepressor [Fructobacillus fructosus]|uniref:ORF6C domain-containing protein n=1 Tax=Fructobacillus fructosus TaxID=1631 RepID=UPI000219605C|nr:ORF6C domain-containing protein [Fructobacillus fructosus]KRN52366.1 antirepressor - phage associated protein [Fructobacillus fructosus KCTC 3544]GAP01451.1 putative antirepressor [Fructobacillus fructosus]
MANEVKVFDNLKVKEENGQVLFDAESAAIGIGIITFAKSGKNYVRWSRVNEYLNSATSGRKVGKGDFITEPQFYKLVMKAGSTQAEKFQDWVTSEVLPSIRKTGSYSVQTDPMAILATTFEALKQQEDKQEKLEQRLNKFEADQEIRSWEQAELLQLRRNRVFAVLGGKYSQAYKELSSEVFHAIAKDFKRQFSVPRYNALPRKYFAEAKRFLSLWEPNNLMDLAIRGANQDQTA